MVLSWRTWGLAISLVVGTQGVCRSQCMDWDPTFGSPLITNGSVASLLVFDDGTGPALYVGGAFTVADVFLANRIAKRTGTGWYPLSTGMDTVVTTLAAFDAGGGAQLYAGGLFLNAGGQAASRIARWNGSTWSALGLGLDDAVFSLAAYDDGTGPALYVGGGFGQAGGLPARRFAKWNGSSWSQVGGGVNGPGYPAVYGMTVFDDGTGPALYVGGSFASAGGTAVNNVAKWNGTTWSPLTSGTNDVVRELLVHDDGTGPALFVAGDFTIAGGITAPRIAKWNGSNWSALGNGTNGVIGVLATFDDGSGPRLYVGGNFVAASGYGANRIARWSGTGWSPLPWVNSGVLNGSVGALAVYDDGNGGGPALYVGGLFSAVGTHQTANIARWLGCGGPGVLYCPTDFGTTFCPCTNHGYTLRGCNNSAATGGALLHSSGSTSPDTVVLHSSGELPSSLSIFLQGDSTIAAVSFGDGKRCAGGTLKRLFVKSAVGGLVSAPTPGDPAITAQSANLGDPITPGMSRYYQTYYRDPDPSFCPPPQGDNWNVTNAVRIVW